MRDVNYPWWVIAGSLGYLNGSYDRVDSACGYILVAWVVSSIWPWALAVFDYVREKL